MQGLGSGVFICNYRLSCLYEIDECIAKGYSQSVIYHLLLGGSQATLTSL